MGGTRTLFCLGGLPPREHSRCRDRDDVSIGKSGHGLYSRVIRSGIEDTVPSTAMPDFDMSVSPFVIDLTENPGESAITLIE
jgi:hypothetical protein